MLSPPKEEDWLRGWERRIIAAFLRIHLRRWSTAGYSSQVENWLNHGKNGKKNRMNYQKCLSITEKEFKSSFCGKVNGQVWCSVLMRFKMHSVYCEFNCNYIYKLYISCNFLKSKCRWRTNAIKFISCQFFSVWLWFWLFMFTIKKIKKNIFYQYFFFLWEREREKKFLMTKLQFICINHS